jgi:hypothetical protein
MSSFALTRRQTATLRATADRIIPPDEWSGAAEAGAADFIMGLLSADLASEQETYLAGLNGIDDEAHARYARSFAELSPAEQDAILTSMEENRVKATWLVSPQMFFQRLVENVLEGFYADPENGGNRDAISWKMIGYRAEGGIW